MKSLWSGSHHLPSHIPHQDIKWLTAEIIKTPQRNIILPISAEDKLHIHPTNNTLYSTYSHTYLYYTSTCFISLQPFFSHSHSLLTHLSSLPCILLYMYLLHFFLILSFHFFTSQSHIIILCSNYLLSTQVYT